MADVAKTIDMKLASYDKGQKPAPYQRTDTELADAFVAAYGNELRFCEGIGKRGAWFVWVGSHWARDEWERARDFAKKFARDLLTEAKRCGDETALKEARRAASVNGVRGILELARCDERIAFSLDQANSNPWLLNTKNGTMDFQTREFRPHDRTDLITMACNAEYHLDAKAPKFAEFLKYVQPEKAMRSYFARLFGYASIGVVQEHVLPVCWGKGNNGKSVLTETVMFALGDYAKPGPQSLVVKDGERNPHPADLASLRGARLVVVQETDKDVRFAASKVKRVTGGDRLSARFMGQDWMDFEPTHTLLMCSNHKPEADSEDDAFWRRAQLAEFGVVVRDDEVDIELTAKLRAEADGVLSWIVQGAFDWLDAGLRPPDAVLEHTREYRKSEDTIQTFMDECCVVHGEAKGAGSKLYGRYRDWCKDGGENPLANRFFGPQLEAKGFRKKKTKTGMVYFGIGLHAAEYDDGERHP